jgi:hypothetical protein
MAKNILDLVLFFVLSKVKYFPDNVCEIGSAGRKSSCASNSKYTQAN